jgi:hypothetical protein
MSDDWYEHAYPGGPMVAVPGFPRALYPADAVGYVASADGPDVLAYKRTIWRAGRWQGPASSFDDSYSNGFAHGKAGGNVGESGVAGVQRQQGVDDTGFIGKATFNTLRSIRIPDGLPNAGQMAMDANAANLIAEAYAKYHPKNQGTTRAQALAGAIGWVGYRESPPGSNSTTFGRWYGVDCQPWCAIFCTYCYEVEAPGSASFVKGSRWAYVPYIVSDARAKRNGLSVTTSPIPGDLVCYDWAYDGTFDHVGLFEDWTGGAHQFTAIEGNTSVDNDSNGGEVMRRTRSTASASVVFVRVAE